MLSAGEWGGLAVVGNWKHTYTWRRTGPRELDKAEGVGRMTAQGVIYESQVWS